METESIELRVDELLEQLTLEEKCGFLAGRDAWHLSGCARLGIPSLRVADCGHGVTIVGESAVEATCFPTGIGMGATWNAELIERVGEVLGKESRAAGVSVLLAPMVNLHRLPVGGRNFETFSEDPFLSGVLGAAQTRGIQKSGTGACLKAMTAYNQQAGQMGGSANMDERTLRELYLSAFEQVVREADPCAIMTSYNKINGEDTADSKHLLREIVKDEWKYKGMVMSDWGGVHSSNVLDAGLDLEMPGPPNHLTLDAVRRKMESEELSETDLNDKVRRVLRVILSIEPPEDEMDPEALISLPEHQNIAREVAEESITLLKNKGDFLPLDASQIKRLALIGPNASTIRLGGGGSASVLPPHRVSARKGLEKYLAGNVELLVEEGCGLSGDCDPIAGVFGHFAPDGRRLTGLHLSFFKGTGLQGTPIHQGVSGLTDFSWGWASPAPGVPRADYSLQLVGYLIPSATGRYPMELNARHGGVKLFLDDQLVAGTWKPEAGGNFEGRYTVQTHTWEHDFEQGKPVRIRLEYRKLGANGGLRLAWKEPGRPSAIARAVGAAEQADAVVLCCGLSNQFEGGNCDRADFNLPGRQNELIQKICVANPNTVLVLNNGTPVAMPWLPQVAALLEAWYPGQEGGHALARILFGEINPSGRLPDTIPEQWDDVPAMENYPGEDGIVEYKEGLMVGYRHDAVGTITPRFPFGFGLSYTAFEYLNLRLSKREMAADENFSIEVDVVNIGERAGKETVQLYLSLPGTDGPLRELKAFEKVEIEPGETRTVHWELTHRELRQFHLKQAAWVVEAGTYTVQIGPHSQEGLQDVFTILPSE